jgi:hypothetical protein
MQRTSLLINGSKTIETITIMNIGSSFRPQRRPHAITRSGFKFAVDISPVAARQKRFYRRAKP